MQINHLLSQLKHSRLQQLLKMKQDNNSNLKNILQNNNPTNKEKLTISNLRNQIFKDPQLSKFSNLNKSVQQNILNTWVNMNLSFKKEHLLKLIQYLGISSQENNISSDSFTSRINTQGNLPQLDSNSIIKAFAFLIKNNLPLTPDLITGLAQNIDDEQTLSDSLRENLIKIGNNKANTENNQNSSIKKLLTLNLSRNNDEIAQKLNNYSQNIKDVIQLLDNLSSDNSKKILNHLLGQQLLNLQENNPENNMLLSLEIPVLLKEDSDPVPLHLQINKDKQQKNNSKDKTNENNYKIKFIMELEKLGTITAHINIVDQYINCQFGADSDKTLNILKNNFRQLQDNLSETGFQVKKTEFKKLNKKNDTAISEFNDDLTQNLKNKSENGDKYVHIDFTI